MSLITSLLILSIIFAILITVSLAPRNDNGYFDKFKPKPYFSKKPLTKTETIFYQRLVEALPGYVVLAQVQLARFIDFDKSRMHVNEKYKWLQPIAYQSVDFLICNKDFSIVTAIELDDKSHASQSVINRDEKKSANLAAAKIPLIRWHAERMPLHEEIKQEISKFLSASGTENNAQDDEVWLIDSQADFFNRSIRKSNPFPVFAFGAFVVLGIFFWTNLRSIDHRKMSAPQPTASNINTQDIQPPAYVRSLNETLNQSSPESLNELIEKKRQELITQQELQKKQDEIRARAMKEERIKEEIWNRNFKNKVDCTNRNDIVACGNDNIANRRKFEVYWEANKSRLLNQY